MRLLSILSLAFILAHGAGADESVPESTEYGFGVNLTESTPFSKLTTDPTVLLDQKVRVEGKIKEVCPFRGCWLDLEDETGAIVRIKVTDGEIEFPVSATGKHAIAEGTWSVTKLTQPQAVQYVRHLYEERGELEDFDPATVTEPMDIYRVMGSGAVIR